MNDSTLVLNERDARGVVTLTLNRAQAFNALSEGMLEALQRELDRVATDASARVVVIAAAGSTVAPCAWKSLQLLSVSRPSGRRPALLLLVRVAPRPPRPPAAGTRQPVAPVPETPCQPSAAQGSTINP